jgi:histidine triad (HIT) family protein
VTSTSIELPSDGTCAFCAYLTGDRPYTVLTRNQVAATLVTREQRGVPHLLVVPVAHRSVITDLTDNEAKEVLIAVREAARLIDRTYHRPGIAVWQNNGVSANQTISHVHFHVAGTLDEGGTDWGEVHELSIEETDGIAERIRAENPGAFTGATVRQPENLL